MLSELEKQVLILLLSGDHFVLQQLRSQLSDLGVRKREKTGVGFFTELYVKQDPEMIKSSFVFGDVIAKLAGMSEDVGFLLFVKDGKLSLLEGYTYGEPWPEKETVIEARYESSPRDWLKLNSKLDEIIDSSGR